MWFKSTRPLRVSARQKFRQASGVSHCVSDGTASFGAMLLPEHLAGEKRH